MGKVVIESIGRNEQNNCILVQGWQRLVDTYLEYPIVFLGDPLTSSATSSSAYNLSRTGFSQPSTHCRPNCVSGSGQKHRRFLVIAADSESVSDITISSVRGMECRSFLPCLFDCLSDVSISIARRQGRLRVITQECSQLAHESLHQRKGHNIKCRMPGNRVRLDMREG